MIIAYISSRLGIVEIVLLEHAKGTRYNFP